MKSSGMIRLIAAGVLVTSCTGTVNRTNTFPPGYDFDPCAPTEQAKTRQEVMRALQVSDHR